MHGGNQSRALAVALLPQVIASPTALYPVAVGIGTYLLSGSFVLYNRILGPHFRVLTRVCSGVTNRIWSFSEEHTMAEVKLYHSGRLQTGNQRHRFESGFTVLMVFIGF
jgi:hypothetical protein